MLSKLDYSFWELDYYANADIVIVGGGIVGINAAICIKECKPKSSVLVIDERWHGGGASVKNAGFICFGSPTEMLDDIEKFGEQYATEIFTKRYEGAIKLLERIEAQKMNYVNVGGLEVYNNKQHAINKHDYLNTLINTGTGLKNYFKTGKQQISARFLADASIMEKEASINPKLMMEALYAIAIELGVKFLQTKVLNVNHLNNEVVTTHYGTIKYLQLGVSLNGFVTDVFPSYKVTPARNLVLITEKLQDINWNSVVHYNKGYVYFRRIGNRILIGGARDIDIETEYSNNILVNEKIENYLLSFLENYIVEGKKIRIEHKYVGILGFNDDCFPEAKKVYSNIWVATGLGGMGVALGTNMGEALANKMLA